MEEEGRIVPAGRTAEGKAVGVRQTGPPWRFWYEGREIAGPEGGAVEKGRYVVKQKGGNLELLRREVVKGEGWAVWIDDEALGEYEKARVVVHPPSLTRGVPHPTHTNGAPLNTIAAFFSSGRHLLGGGNCCAVPISRPPQTRSKLHIVKPSDRKAKETRLVQWFKEHEVQLMLQGISLDAESLYNNCIDMLHLVEESMVKEDELFFSVYISQAVAKVGLALLLNSAEIDTRLKELINDLLKKKPPNMVFYELEWLRKGLEIVKEIEDFEWDTVDILIKCVTSITSMSFSVVLTDLLNLSRKAYSMAKGNSEHNHYFGIAAIERTAAVVKNRLLWYHLLQADEKAAAKAELKTYLLEVQSERGRLETWEVAFAWVKLIADILIFNPAVVTQASINKLLKDENMDENDVTLEGLRAKGWLVEHTSDGGKHNVSVLTSSCSSHWRSGSTDKITNMLDKHPRQPIPNDLQELLVTGSEGFHGLAHFAKMGISTPRSLVVVLEEANTLLKGKKPVNEMQQGLKGLLNNTLNGAANFAGLFVENKANIWRVRDRAVVACIDVLSRNNVSAPCARELQATLTNCEVFEQNSDVRRTLKNPGVYKETAAFLKKSWKTQEEEVQESIKTTMDRLEELQHSMLNCTLPNITKELRAVMNEVNNELDHQVKSLQGMQEKLGVTLDFLMGIQRRQLSMEKDLTSSGDIPPPGYEEPLAAPTSAVSGGDIPPPGFEEPLAATTASAISGGDIPPPGFEEPLAAPTASAISGGDMPPPGFEEPLAATTTSAVSGGDMPPPGFEEPLAAPTASAISGGDMPPPGFEEPLAATTTSAVSGGDMPPPGFEEPLAATTASAISGGDMPPPGFEEPLAATTTSAVSGGDMPPPV